MSHTRDFTSCSQEWDPGSLELDLIVLDRVYVRSFEEQMFPVSEKFDGLLFLRLMLPLRN
jgi:hypothetical protein